MAETNTPGRTSARRGQSEPDGKPAAPVWSEAIPSRRKAGRPAASRIEPADKDGDPPSGSDRQDPGSPEGREGSDARREYAGSAAPADASRDRDAAPDHTADSEKAAEPTRDQGRGSGALGRPGRKRQVWVWAAVAALVVLLGGSLYWYRSKPAPGGQGGQARNDQQGAASGPQRTGGKVPVEIAEAKTADLPLYLNGLGTVQAFNTVVIRSRVDGEIQTIAFDEGQMVKQGDLLVQIDPRPYQASLDQAVAARAQHEATLASAKLDLERTQQLATKGFAPQQTLDQQTANVRNLQAQIVSDEASIGAAQTQLGYTTIRAPISGRTGLRLIDRGNIARASDTTGIVEIAQLQPISVIFTAPEGELRPIAAALKSGGVEVTAFSSDRVNVLDTGRLALVNNEVDAASGTIRLKATFDNREDRLWPGLSVVTRLRERTLRGVVAVPSEAVQRGQNELFTYVVGEGDKVEKRVIKIGPFTEGLAVIEDGLRPGEKVVVAGQYRLQPGSPVEIRQAPKGNDPSGQNNRAADRSASSGG